MLKAIKNRIYPDRSQQEFLEKNFGCGRFVYNKLLEKCIEEYERHKENPNYPKPKLNYVNLVKEITALKAVEGNEFLKEPIAVALQQKAIDLSKAFSNFFKKKGSGYPKFKKKSHSQSFRLVGTTFSIENNRLSIYKCSKTIKMVLDKRGVPVNPSSVTISRNSSGQYFASFVCEVHPNLTTGSGQIGIDFGLKDFITTSNGVKVKNPKYFVRNQKQLRRKQRVLSRRQKGSKNRDKAKLAVARQHQKVVNFRSDFLHKLSRQLINDNQVIGIESLNIQGMSKNGRLAKHILDSGWREFTTQLSYKAEESARTILARMDPFYPSSHLCSETNLRLNRKLELRERSWKCPHCGNNHDRDINAANNMRKRALELIRLLKPLPGSTIQDDLKIP